MAEIVMGDKELYSYYKGLLYNGIIKVGGPSHKRMMQIEDKIEKHKKKMMRKYGKSYYRK